jgi:hypothetical protein
VSVYSRVLPFAVVLWACDQVRDGKVPPSPVAITPTTPSMSTPTSAPTEVVCDEPLAIEWISEPGGDPLTDGDSVLLEHGPQGGWHVALHAGIVGADARSVVAHASVTLASTGDALAGDDNSFVLGMFGWAPDSCAGTMRGMLAYLDDPPGVDQAFVCGLVGQDLVVSLTVADHAGVAEDAVEVQVVGVADPTDECP